MIKAIIFDYGGVVGTNVMSFIHERVARKVGLPFEIVKGEYKKFSSTVQKGKMSMHMFWLKLGEALKIEPNELEEIWMDVFEEEIKINEEVKEIIRLLKNGGYKVALCTNNVPSFVERHKRNGDFDIFPVQIISCEVGMRKPDREIYEFILKKLNVRAEECVFIDDRPVNVEAAKSVGMNGILFRDIKQLREELKKCGVYGL